MDKAKASAIAEEIIEKIGGKENITVLTHCATRLRFKLADYDKADKEAAGKIKGVVTALVNGGQFQVVIGNEVTDVFREVQAQTGISGKAEDVIEKDDLKVKILVTRSITTSIPLFFTFKSSFSMKIGRASCRERVYHDV